MFLIAAFTTLNAINLLEGAAAALALYVSTKPAIRNPKRTTK